MAFLKLVLKTQVLAMVDIIMVVLCTFRHFTAFSDDLPKFSDRQILLFHKSVRALLNEWY